MFDFDAHMGLVRDCITLVEPSTRIHQHTNCFEIDQAEDLRAARLGALLDAGPPSEALYGWWKPPVWPSVVLHSV